jgi:hypothetical protein
MRAATSFVLMALGVIVYAAPTNGAERATTFSFRAPIGVQRQVETRDPRAEHHRVRRKQHRLESLVLVPFDTWYDGTTAVPLPPATPAEVAAPAPTPLAQLPACRETVEGVTVIRGQPCRA